MSILSILATMSVTLVSKARVNARESAAIATLNSLAGAYEAYWSRNGVYPQWGENMKFSDPHALFMSLVRDGYLPGSYSSIPYIENDKLFYLITDDYALEIFPFDSANDSRAPSNYYWLLMHPLGFQRQQGFLGIGTTLNGGHLAVRPRAGMARNDIDFFTLYGPHRRQ